MSTGDLSTYQCLPFFLQSFQVSPQRALTSLVMLVNVCFEAIVNFVNRAVFLSVYLLLV